MPWSGRARRCARRSDSRPSGACWHYGHPHLANRHLLIFGASGSGKTYGIQCLLAEMAGAGLRSLIVDYTDGFLPHQVEPLFDRAARPMNHFVVTDRLPLTPFKRQEYEIDPSRPRITEPPYQVAMRIASIFTSVYDSIGDQQQAALMRALEKGIAADAAFTLAQLLARLRADSPYGESLANKLEPLIKAAPFRAGDDSAWERLLTRGEHSVHVLQLKGLGRDVQRLVTEFASGISTTSPATTATRTATQGKMTPRQARPTPI